MRRAPVLSLAVALWGLSAAAASAIQLTESPSLEPSPLAQLFDERSVVDLARIENTPDSLSFSDSRLADEFVPTLDDGQGFVRSLLQSPFGDTALAVFLFERRAIVYLLLLAGVFMLEVLFRLGARAPVELSAPTLAMGGGRTLPLVGSDHPIERAATSFSRRAAGIAVVMHLILLATWLVARNLPQPLPLPDGMRRIIDMMPVPISIVHPRPVQDDGGGSRQPPVAVGLPEMTTDASIFTPPLEDVGQGGLAEDGAGSVGSGILDLPNVEVRVLPPPARQPVDERYLDPGAVPVLVDLPKPVYPETARSAEVQGIVTLQILVGEDGRVQDVKVTSGHPMLITAAVQSARRARFQPARQQGRPVAVWVELPLRFALY